MDNRERIIESAAELFRTYGIKAVTMDSLANHLGMSKRTIYEIFSDKDELLIGVFKWMAQRQRDLLNKILAESDTAVDAIFKLLKSNFDHFQNMSPAFQADMKRFHQDVLMKKAGKCEFPDNKNNIMIIERAIKEKFFRKDINPEIVNRCFDIMGKSMMNNEIYPFEQFSRIDVLANTFLNYMKGISTPQGLELINKLEKEYKFR